MDDQVISRLFFFFKENSHGKDKAIDILNHFIFLWRVQENDISQFLAPRWGQRTTSSEEWNVSSNLVHFQTWPKTPNLQHMFLLFSTFVTTMGKPWVVVSQISKSPLIEESCPGELPDYKGMYWPLRKDQKQNKTPNPVKPLRIGAGCLL